MAPENKKEYDKQRYLDKKAEKEELEQEFEEYKALDEEKNYAPGEFSTWVDLWKIYRGVDPKATALKISKKNTEFINPSACNFLGAPLTFKEWIDKRKNHRGDMWDLAHIARAGGWSEGVHRPLSDFFVKKDNSTLPFDYTETDKNKWLLKQDVQHRRLLLYPRGSRKSTVNILDAVQWILNCPDIVILVVTSTRSLASDFIKLLRDYFTIKDYNSPTDFQVLFPDFCIPEDRGKKSGDSRRFLCPKRRLRIASPTVALSSMESSTAGVRADVIKFDDAVDEINYKQVESRQAVYAKFLAALELLVGSFGYWDDVGTRYTDGLKSDTERGAVPDLHGQIIKTALESPELNLKILCKPAWTVNPGFENVPIKQLEESMVTLLDQDPEGAGNWRALKEKLTMDKDPDARWFRCQQLNEPMGELDNEDDYINTFTEENIRKKLRRREEAPMGRTILLVDTAMTAGRKSDYSAFAVARIVPRAEQNPSIWWMEIRAGHYTDQQVAETIPELMKRWNCEAYVEEIPSTSTTFKNEVRRQMFVQGVPDGLTLTWFMPDQTPAAKETRIRGLQMLHELDLCFYCTDSWSVYKWIELMIVQLTSYNGDKKRHKNSRGGRKDDIPDAMSYVHKFLPFIQGVHTEKEKEAQKAFEEMVTRQRLKNLIFGTSSNTPLSVTTAKPPEQQTNRDPIHSALDALKKNIGEGPVLGFPKRSADNRG